LLAGGRLVKPRGSTSKGCIVTHYPYHHWTGVTTARLAVTQDLLTTPLLDDYHIALRNNDDMYERSIWFPRVDVLVTVNAGSPVPQWWIGSYVNFTVVFDTDQTSPVLDITSLDPRLLGFTSLQPVCTVINSAGDHVVTYKAPEQGLQLRGNRKGTAGIQPAVSGQLGGFDHFNVLELGSGTHVNIAYTCASRVLWGSTSP
jgi:hypothetical protein